MKSYAGNIQGVQNRFRIVPQEVCVMEIADDGRIIHGFVKLPPSYTPSDRTFSYIYHKIHGIPPTHGDPRLSERVKNFFAGESGVLYVKGEQQAESFRRLLAGTEIDVQSLEHVKTSPSAREERCGFHEKKSDSLYCAREKCYLLKTAMASPEQTSDSSEVCFFHGETCRQPKDLCRMLWGTGTYRTLVDCWSPSCAMCQNPLTSSDSVYYYCTRTNCKKFNSCVVKVLSRNVETHKIEYVSGVRLSDGDLKKIFYRNW